MLVTMLEARVAPERASQFVNEYGDGVGELPPFIVETYLLAATDSDVWRIVTVWRSREDLETYRASVETPAGVRMFRAVDAEPTLSVFDVAHHAAR